MSDVTRETQAQRESRHAPLPPVGALSRWLAPAALLVAVVAVALAIWALMSASSNAPAAAQQAGDPKMRVCTAFDTVSKAVTGQTHNDLGPDPVAQAAVASNARLALVGGGQYLLSRLDSATPTELADPVRSFANDLQDIGMYALAGVSNTEPEQAARLTQADLVRKQIVELCK
jgi:hypothetical protein